MSKICPSVRNERKCKQRGCSFIHTVFRCRICRAPFASQISCNQHTSSAAHRDAVTYRCTLCSVLSSSQVDYGNHVLGRKHKNNLAASRSQVHTEPIEMTVPPGNQPCYICDTLVPEKTWTQHVKGKRHQSLLSGQAFTKALDNTETNKFDIQLDCDSVNFGIVNGTSGTAVASKEVKVSNNGASAVVLTEAKISSSMRGNIFHVKEASRARKLNLGTFTIVKLKLSATKSARGLFQNRLELHFEIPSQRRRFTITRAITATVGSKDDYETIKSSKSYVPRKRARSFRITRFYHGVRPQILANITWVRRLDTFNEPEGLASVALSEDQNLKERVVATRSSFMSGAFGQATYAKHMQTMLWIEEEQARIELSHFDMVHAFLTPQGTYYELEIKGLAEKRPSVLVGDSIFAVLSNSSDDPFQGFVHFVKDKSVLLRFNKKFKWIAGRTYNIHFDLNRLVFRRMHQAITCPTHQTITCPTPCARIAFPELASELSAVTNAFIGAIRPFDTRVASNEQQHRAVASILHMPPGSIPFIIYGPPGTGKTITMVEAIRQIVARDPDARILACAPSNSAADIIAERLAPLGDKALIRLVAPSRAQGKILSNVLQFTRTNEHGVFVCPPRAELEAFRVIVSTCCNASVPYGIGVDPGHFSHVFVDEAAQANECEVMIPIRTMLGPNTNVILSGDIKQLGPIIRSAVARELGLGQSFLERLMSTPTYGEDTAKGKSLVKLLKNYRSHPAILDFPNAKFYMNELQPCADCSITHCISQKWGGLIKKDYPVIFHGVCGRDLREDPSPSYFNIEEASAVREYVKTLLEDTSLHLRPQDIGIITPYRAQVLRIRQLLCGFAKETVVGSVEEFQGQERRVIIISTVRSSPDTISFDIRHTLGFVANPRRFNVAVTRAQALLVVIGDPFVLELDPMWKEFINHVYIRGGYTGEPIDWDPTELVDYSVRADEARRTRGLSELEELIRRTSDMDLDEDEELEYNGLEDTGLVREED